MQSELEILARLSHPNIVRVYGGCMQPPTLFVVAELMAGDLDDCIHGHEGKRKPSLPLHTALGIALDILKGLVSCIDA